MDIMILKRLQLTWETTEAKKLQSQLMYAREAMKDHPPKEPYNELNDLIQTLERFLSLPPKL